MKSIPFASYISKVLRQNKYLLLIDQALLSLINFGSILFLAKKVSTEVFAAFVLIYSYHLFVYMVSSASISSPILVFLRKKWHDKEESYFTSVLSLHVVVCSLLIPASFFVLKQQVPTVHFYSFFLMSFCITLFEVLKKYVFSSKLVNLKYGLYSTILLNFIFFSGLFFTKIQNVNSILALYWGAFLAASFLLFLFIFFKGKHEQNQLKISKQLILSLQTVGTQHFHFAKWILIGGIGFWAYTQGIYILAEIFHISDLTLSKVRTLQNLLAVFNILAISIENHYTPIFAERMKTHSEKNKLLALLKRAYIENYKKISFLFILSIPIGLLFYNFMYMDKYGKGTSLFFIFLLIQLLTICARPITVALKAIEKTSVLFVSHLFAFCGAIIVLYFLAKDLPYYAIPISIAVAVIIYTCVLFVHFKKNLRK